jgi:hypothetical protein
MSGPVHPLSPFLFWRVPAPYHTASFRRWDEFQWQTRVVAVRCLTGLARSRSARTRYVHRVESMAGVLIDGVLQVGARWLCRNRGTSDALIVVDATGFEMCQRCEDAYIGPAVYRCYSTTGDLLYIGATRSLAYRLRQHELSTPWWFQVARVDDERFADMDAAFAAESAAIKAESPICNGASRSLLRDAS